MASTRRKSAAIALAVIGVAGLSLASAAQLNVNAGSLGAGSTTIDAPCDADGVRVNLDATTFSGGEYQADGVTVSGIDATGCANQTLRITVTDRATGTVVLDDATTTVSAATASFPLDANAPAKNIFDIAVVIYG